MQIVLKFTRLGILKRHLIFFLNCGIGPTLKDQVNTNLSANKQRIFFSFYYKNRKESDLCTKVIFIAAKDVD